MLSVDTMKKRRIHLFTFLALISGFCLSSCENLIPGLRFNGFNAYALAEKIANAATRYGSSVNAESLISRSRPYAELLSSSSQEDRVSATMNDFVLMAHEAFKDVIPAHIGARTFQGFPMAYDRLVETPLDEQSEEALRFLLNRGLYAESQVYFQVAPINEKRAQKMLDRFHAYIGTSYVDDFFSAANHDFLYDACPIQSEDPLSETMVYESRMIPQSHINSWAKSLLEQAPRAKAFNDSFMDVQSRENGNLAGLRPTLNALLGAETLDEFVAAMQQEAVETGYCPLWDGLSFVDATLSDGRKNYYKRAAFASCFSSDQPSYIYENGYGTAEDASDSFERSVARFTPIFQEGLASSTSEAYNLAYNYTHFKYLFCAARERLERELPDRGGQLNGNANIYLGRTSLRDFLTNIGVADCDCFFWKSEIYGGALLSLFSSEGNLPYLKGFAVWQLFAHYTSCLPKGAAIDKWAFGNRYGNDEAGLSDDRLWGAYCLPHISGILANEFEKTEGYHEQISALVDLLGDLKNAMRSRIESQDWLSPSSKSTLKEKLDNLRYSIGGSNSDGTFLHYSEPAYQADAELFDNLAIEENANFDEKAALIGSDWASSNSGANPSLDFFGYCQAEDPLTANAFYMPSANGMDIYTGFLAAYDDPRTLTAESFYATFGHTIAHELSHAFDTGGVNFDKNGRYSEALLTDKEATEYWNRAAAVAVSYDHYEVMPGEETDGFGVINEAIADITGTALCLDMASKEHPSFDYRAFFIAVAQDMGAFASQRTYVENIAGDEHPFGRARVNTCFHLLDKFHETFDTKESDAMYLPAKDRVTVW